jgi:hypothetical protein
VTTSAASSADVSAVSLPDTTGMPSERANSRAATLSPNSDSASAGGPTNIRPASSQRRANVAFSDRKPYPGWTQSQPVPTATAISASMSR